MKEELGGKGAGLAEMTNAGLPVPPGFTIQTAACREFMKTPKFRSAGAPDDGCAGTPGRVAEAEAGRR